MTSAEGPNGRDRPLCGARKRQGDHEPCRRPAGWGTDHVGIGRCKLHGGATRDHGTAAKRQMAVDAVATFGLPREVDPQQALLEEVHRTAGHVAWLGQKIGEFATDSELKQLDMSERFEKPSVWVEMYERERIHLVRVSKACVDAGVAERQVRLAEAQGQMLASVLRDVLAEVFVRLIAAGLDAVVLGVVQREQVPMVVRGRLAELVEVTG